MTTTRLIRAGLEGAPLDVDVLVVGLGATGAGCALDATARGLSVLAVDAHDLAFGTSRWSSKLVHGGLRYLANGQVGVAHESAVERGILMEVTAPHLTHALPMLLPLDSRTGRRQAALLRAGVGAGDWLRIAARTSRETLPRPRSISATETRHLAPVLRPDVRGAILSWDGQLEDDARLVTTIARTAAGLGAEIRTRARVVELSGTGAVLRDELTGTTYDVTARAVVNAAGVWAGGLVDDVRLRPSRGTHLVVRGEALPGLQVALTLPVYGEHNRFLNVLPQPDGLCYIGLTDEPIDGDPPDVPEPSGSELDFLVATVSSNLAHPLTRADVVGAYAGLRPLLRAHGRTSDLSRRHAVLTSPSGVVTVVGGKLTTYRRMAREAVRRAVKWLRANDDDFEDDRNGAGTKQRPLPGADGLAEATLAGVARIGKQLIEAHGLDGDTATHLCGVYGVRATRLAEAIAADRALGERINRDLPYVWAEVDFAVDHDLARTVDDVLARRVPLLLTGRDQGLDVCERVADRMAARLGWSAAERGRQLDEYRVAVADSRRFRAPAGAATANAATAAAATANAATAGKE
jgi:glycerol-3-phosphate dehydrogenase